MTKTFSGNLVVGTLKVNFTSSTSKKVLLDKYTTNLIKSGIITLVKGDEEELNLQIDSVEYTHFDEDSDYEDVSAGVVTFGFTTNESQYTLKENYDRDSIRYGYIKITGADGHEIEIDVHEHEFTGFDIKPNEEGFEINEMMEIEIIMDQQGVRERIIIEAFEEHRHTTDITDEHAAEMNEDEYASLIFGSFPAIYTETLLNWQSENMEYFGKGGV